MMRREVRLLAMAAKGFLSESEGIRLFELAKEVSPRGPCLEIGSYCGKSALFLGEGCRVAGVHPLISVDHHHGSAEQQPGQEYFDHELFEEELGVVNTLGAFMRTVLRAGLADWVIPVISDSRQASRYLSDLDLSLLFIDGGHSEEDAFGDFHAWADRVAAGGYLCIHDLHSDHHEGGLAPFHVFEHARATGRWDYVDQVETLGVLRRRSIVRSSTTDRHTESSNGGPSDDRVRVETTRSLGSFPCARTADWMIVGQDGGQSIDLGDRTLFVFSDTLLGVPFAGHRRSGAGSRIEGFVDSHPKLLANAAGLSSEPELRQALSALDYYRDESGRPRQILAPTVDESGQRLRFWPQHGIFLDGKVFIYYLGIRSEDAASTWGFKNVGVGLAQLDPETGLCDRLFRDGDWRHWGPISDDFHLGVQVLREDDHVYVFGSSRVGMSIEARLARVAVDRISDPDAYEFLTSPDVAWGEDPASAYSLGPCASDYSVSFNPYLKKYVMFYVDAYTTGLTLRTADRLVGPYSSPVRLATVPRRPTSELVYLGFEHPKFRQEGGRVVYVSFSEPRFASNSLVKLRFA